ncbi:putative zinc ribbon protein [Serratia sp. UGAL515B_01]|uniref:putative zinc ribbon protein n=1 Tax=Serratia sp. UGAL515B_01 TaxID=2986763 RepID=UPI0029534397|nr:putative zinc ribbon protein [Serratia sp. UGAL515B_01]WON77398.1 zinc-ribbon domain-containing protein [Serratia sp. UGAL515B_01]
MQFKKLREACTLSGERVHVDTLLPDHTVDYYCGDCHNRLTLHVTHTKGRYFEHDLEQVDIKTAQDCCYRLTQREPHTSPNIEWQFVLALGYPASQPYFCALCDKEYEGLKTCPDCKSHIYTTEVSLRDCSGGVLK